MTDDLRQPPAAQLTQPKISIALCTYNGAVYLREQIDSILGQSLLPFELVVCDDRSEDGTIAILEEYTGVAPFPIRISINEERLGSIRNFEKAITLCAGEIIALSDQDDVWLPRKLELIAAEFASDPAIGAVFSDAEVVDEQLRPVGLTMFEHDSLGQAEQAKFKSDKPYFWMLANTFVVGMTLAFRSAYRSIVVPIPTEDKLMIHDRWIILTIAAVARVSPIPEPLVKYRQHGRQQIGAVWAGRSEGGIANAGPVPNKEVRDIHGQALASLRTLHARAVDFVGAGSLHPKVAAALKSNIAHLQARSSMPRQRLRRLPRIIGELASGRYFRHSRGFYSAAKDFIV